MGGIKTYQDLQAARAKGQKGLEKFVVDAMDEHLSAVPALNELMAYYRGQDPRLQSQLRRLKGLNIEGLGSIDLEPCLKITSGFAKKCVDTIAARLWSNPVQVRDIDIAEALGRGFPKTAKRAQKLAGVYGVCHAFYDNGNVILFEPTQYLPLLDEMDGKEKAGIRFWRLDEKRPWNVQLYEMDGFTWWRRGEGGKDNEMTIYTETLNGGTIDAKGKRPYISRRARNEVFGDTVSGDNYPDFPVIPLYNNDEHTTALNEAGLSKVQAMNLAETQYTHEAIRNPFITWIIQGYGGNVKDLNKLKQMVQALGIISPGDESETKIETVPLEIPHEAHETSMNRYRRGIYADWQMADMDEMSGGSLTNVVIKARLKEESARADDAEALSREWLRQLLFVAGHDISINDIIFQHSTLVNELEFTQRIVQLVNAEVLLREIAPKLEPMIIHNGLIEDVEGANAAKQLAMDKAALEEFERQKAELEARLAAEAE